MNSQKIWGLMVLTLIRFRGVPLGRVVVLVTEPLCLTRFERYFFSRPALGSRSVNQFVYKKTVLSTFEKQHAQSFSRCSAAISLELHKQIRNVLHYLILRRLYHLIQTGREGVYPNTFVAHYIRLYAYRDLICGRSCLIDSKRARQFKDVLGHTNVHDSSLEIARGIVHYCSLQILHLLLFMIVNYKSGEVCLPARACGGLSTCVLSHALS